MDISPESWENKEAMSKKTSHPKNTVYPDQTAGAKTARRLRSEANKLTEQQREELFKRGMQIVYGGAGSKETVGAGH
jgi:hypothetical protein